MFISPKMLNKKRYSLQKAILRGCRCCSDMLPMSEVKIIRKKKIVTSDNPKEEKVQNQNKISKEFRVNEVNVQMISKNIYDQLFKCPNLTVDFHTIHSCQNSLLKHGIDYKNHSHLPDVAIKLPELEGEDIVEYFYNIGEQQAAPYRNLLIKLASSTLPPLPKKWSRSSGWTKYVGDTPHPVPCPPDDALLFDVEVLMSAGKRPTLACAVSSDAWYAWISEPIANGEPHTSFDNINYNNLIPIETDGVKPCGDLQRPRIIVGHNVSFDRAKIKEQYWLERTGVRFMDTMSMHTCVSGVTSYQRTVLKAKNKEPHPSDSDWMEISSLNNLSEVHNLYCGSLINKETRNIFVEGTMDDVHENFQDLMRYCSGDVIATHNILRELLPLFLERFPHPVTLAGMLELGSAYLPVNSNWLQYIDSAETVFEDLKLESRQVLSQKADEACRMMKNEDYRKDLWMWDQDWSTQKLKLKKQVKKKKVDTPVADTEVKEISENRTIPLDKEFEILNEEYIQSIIVENQDTQTQICHDKAYGSTLVLGSKTNLNFTSFSFKMSSSAIYILDVKGKVLISRNYRGDVDMGVIDKFMPLLMDKEEEGMLTPLLQTSECTFAYIKTNNLYIVSTTKKNANIALVFVFLYKIVEVMAEYFKELEEESIRDNFVVIYELLDELIDFGYPQTTDSKILQEYITQEGHKLEMQPRIPMAVTNAVSWRSEGIKYRKNEVFLDVIEAVNLLANSNGNVLRSEIVGAIKMRVYLSGMPELRLGLNDKVLFESTGRGKSKSVELEDVKFHQCVRLSRFENDRTISFIPPDGEFELMSYRLNTHVKPLIWIESVIERHAHSRVEYMIKAKSQFKRRSTANNVEIIIPVPADADSPKFKTTIGSVKYTPEQNAITWSIKSFPGGKEYLMRAHFGLPSVECEEVDGKPPIQVKFEIPYFTTSGIQVRYLKIIEKSGYQALPWVRYITQNGDYQLRTN